VSDREVVHASGVDFPPAVLGGEAVVGAKDGDGGHWGHEPCDKGWGEGEENLKGTYGRPSLSCPNGIHAPFDVAPISELDTALLSRADMQLHEHALLARRRKPDKLYYVP